MTATLTIADLIAHLQTLPQDLTVQCVQEIQIGYTTKTVWKDASINDFYVIGGFLEIGDK